jgi:hypothetical protein
MLIKTESGNWQFDNTHIIQNVCRFRKRWKKCSKLDVFILLYGIQEWVRGDTNVEQGWSVESVKYKRYTQCWIRRGSPCSHWPVMRQLRQIKIEGLYDLSEFGLRTNYYILHFKLAHITYLQSHWSYTAQELIFAHVTFWLLPAETEDEIQLQREWRGALVEGTIHPRLVLPPPPLAVQSTAIRSASPVSTLYDASMNTERVFLSLISIVGS